MVRVDNTIHTIKPSRRSPLDGWTGGILEYHDRACCHVVGHIREGHFYDVNTVSGGRRIESHNIRWRCLFSEVLINTTVEGNAQAFHIAWKINPRRRGSHTVDGTHHRGGSQTADQVCSNTGK